MKKLFRSIIEQILPSLSAFKANKQLKKKISSMESQSDVPYMDNVDSIPIDSFRQKYAETFEVKNKFEDKAKTNVIGITIAITVIMGASGLTGSLINKYPYPILHWVSFIILLVAIVYLLVSGIDAIKVLFDENVMSKVDLPDLAADDISTKEKYDDCTNRNIHRNTVRNNIVYSSYICIRNALICMMVLFVLVSVPFSYSKKGDGNVTIISSDASVSYSSTITIPDKFEIADNSKLNLKIDVDGEFRLFGLTVSILHFQFGDDGVFCRVFRRYVVRIVIQRIDFAVVELAIVPIVFQVVGFCVAYVSD